MKPTRHRSSSRIRTHISARRSPVAVLALGGGLMAMVSGCASSSTSAPAPAAEGSLTATAPALAGTPDSNPPALPPPEGNPFAGAAFFVNPAYAAKVEAAATKAAPADAALMRKVIGAPTAVWVSSIADVSKLPSLLR